jgi:hypothetical protein
MPRAFDSWIGYCYLLLILDSSFGRVHLRCITLDQLEEQLPPKSMLVRCDHRLLVFPFAYVCFSHLEGLQRELCN